MDRLLLLSNHFYCPTHTSRSRTTPAENRASPDYKTRAHPVSGRRASPPKDLIRRNRGHRHCLMCRHRAQLERGLQGSRAACNASRPLDRARLWPLQLTYNPRFIEHPGILCSASHSPAVVSAAARTLAPKASDTPPPSRHHPTAPRVGDIAYFRQPAASCSAHSSDPTSSASTVRAGVTTSAGGIAYVCKWSGRVSR